MNGHHEEHEQVVHKDKDDSFIPISVLTIIPGTRGQFDLYLKRGESFVLYSHKGDLFSDEKLAKVLSVTDFYIVNKHKHQYEQYLAKNLGDLLQNEDVPIKVRTKVFYNISASVMKKTFDAKLPKAFHSKMYEEMMNIVRASILFFRDPEALRSFSQLISHNYHSYSHSIQTMVLLISLLRHVPGTDKRVMMACATGALLHDIGKTVVPVEILAKAPDKLEPHEWDVLKTHPAKGVRIVSPMNLCQASVNSILFHHEKMDGTGYPGGLASREEIPFEARAVSVCNVYDVLTTEKSYAPALPPYAALTLMREDLAPAFDQDIFKRLVFVLGDAGLA